MKSEDMAALLPDFAPADAASRTAMGEALLAAAQDTAAVSGPLWPVVAAVLRRVEAATDPADAAAFVAYYISPTIRTALRVATAQGESWLPALRFVAAAAFPDLLRQPQVASALEAAFSQPDTAADVLHILADAPDLRESVTRLLDGLRLTPAVRLRWRCRVAAATPDAPPALAADLLHAGYALWAFYAAQTTQDDLSPDDRQNLAAGLAATALTLSGSDTGAAGALMSDIFATALFAAPPTETAMPSPMLLFGGLLGGWAFLQTGASGGLGLAQQIAPYVATTYPALGRFFALYLTTPRAVRRARLQRQLAAQVQTLRADLARRADPALSENMVLRQIENYNRSHLFRLWLAQLRDPAADMEVLAAALPTSKVEIARTFVDDAPPNRRAARETRITGAQRDALTNEYAALLGQISTAIATRRHLDRIGGVQPALTPADTAEVQAESAAIVATLPPPLQRTARRLLDSVLLVGADDESLPTGRTTRHTSGVVSAPALLADGHISDAPHALALARRDPPPTIADFLVVLVRDLAVGYDTPGGLQVLITEGALDLAAPVLAGLPHAVPREPFQRQIARRRTAATRTVNTAQKRLAQFDAAFSPAERAQAAHVSAMCARYVADGQIDRLPDALAALDALYAAFWARVRHAFTTATARLDAWQQEATLDAARAAAFIVEGAGAGIAGQKVALAAPLARAFAVITADTPPTAEDEAAIYAAADALYAAAPPPDAALRDSQAATFQAEEVAATDPARAEALYRYALARQPHNTAAVRGLAALLERDGRTAEAIKVLDAALAWADEKQPLYVALLRLAGRGGNPAQLRGYALRALAEAEGDERFPPLYMLAQTERATDPAQALAYAEEALTLRDNPQIEAWAADLRAALGQA